MSKKTSYSVVYNNTTEIQISFDNLKEPLASAPVLVYPDYSKPFIVSSDASSITAGAVLSQEDNNWREHPIHYLSINLNNAEKKPPEFERETLGVVFTLKHFQHYLTAIPIT